MCINLFTAYFFSWIDGEDGIDDRSDENTDEESDDEHDEREERLSAMMRELRNSGNKNILSTFRLIFGLSRIGACDQSTTSRFPANKYMLLTLFLPEVSLR